MVRHAEQGQLSLSLARPRWPLLRAACNSVLCVAAPQTRQRAPAARPRASRRRRPWLLLLQASAGERGGARITERPCVARRSAQRTGVGAAQPSAIATQRRCPAPSLANELDCTWAGAGGEEAAPVGSRGEAGFTPRSIQGGLQARGWTGMQMGHASIHFALVLHP